MPISAETLLPLSYALSRPFLRALPSGKLSAILPIILALICRFINHVLKGLSELSKPDALMRGLALLCRLVGTGSLWLAAEASAELFGAVQFGTLNSPATAPNISSITAAGRGCHCSCWCPNLILWWRVYGHCRSCRGGSGGRRRCHARPPLTSLTIGNGLLAVGGTTLAYLLPRLLDAHQQGRIPYLAPWRWARSFKLAGARVPAYSNAMEDLSANAASRGRSGVFERSVDRFERTTSAKGAMAATRGSGGSRFGVSGEGDGSADVRHVSMHDVSGSERRELFGFRRTVKATASGIIRAFHTSFDDMEPGSGGGRRFSSGNSIVTNTEAFTETALAAKNEELRALASKNDDLAAEKSDLERVVSAGSKLAPGVAEVMALLSRATEAHAAAHASDTHCRVATVRC